MRYLPLSITALTLCASLQAQCTVVIPKGTAKTEANASSNLPWGYGGNNGSRVFYGYDPNHFTDQGVNGPITITKMRWRGNGGVVFAGGGTYGLAIVTMSTMTNPISSLTTSTSFAGQHGPNVSVAFSGSTAMGALSGSTPNDWYIDITLTIPFVYDPADGPLMIELACDGAQYTGTAVPAAGIRLDLGSLTANGYNRNYELTSHTSTAPTGTNECGAVCEITYTPAPATIDGRFHIPLGTANTEANASSNLPWGYGGNNGSRVFYAYDSNHFTDQGITGPTTITRMRFRGNGGVVFAGGGTYGLAICRISTAPNPISSLTTSTTFAGQHGADETLCYSGPVDMGALSGSTPNDYYIDFTLQTPFTYNPDNGDPIMIELACDGAQYTGTAVPAAGIRLDLGSLTANGYNRNYELTSHTAAAPTGTNECGAVIEIFTGMYSDVGSIDLAAGGTQTLEINAGLDNANELYGIYGSVTGTTGFSLFGVHIPLDPDPYTDLIFGLNNGVLTNFHGILDGSGNATATLNLPGNLPVPGCSTAYHAAIFYKANGVIVGASGAVKIRLQ